MIRTGMQLRNRLSRRIRMEDIFEILQEIKNDPDHRQQLHRLIFDPDDGVAYQAMWVCTHFDSRENRLLFPRQNELIDELLVCSHSGKRRLLLNLIRRQPVQEPLRTDFLDFCLSRMDSPAELPGVRSLCMKQAFELCRQAPELLNELRLILEMMESAPLPISVRTVRKQVLKAIPKKNIRLSTSVKYVP